MGEDITGMAEVEGPATTGEEDANADWTLDTAGIGIAAPAAGAEAEAEVPWLPDCC